MSVVKELIRTEADGGISFGDYELAAKAKKSDFEHRGDPVSYTHLDVYKRQMYMVRREELVERGDMVIFTAGDPATNEVTGEGYMTNMLHIIQAK